VVKPGPARKTGPGLSRVTIPCDKGYRVAKSHRNDWQKLPSIQFFSLLSQLATDSFRATSYEALRPVREDHAFGICLSDRVPLP